MSAELAARACQQIIDAAQELRTLTGRQHDLCFLQTVLTDARLAFKELDAAVLALGWKCEFLESEFGQSGMKGK